MTFKNNLKAFFLKKIAYKKNLLFETQKFKKILIFRYDRIGDMIVTTPFISALRKIFPRSKIIVLASNSNAEVLRMNRRVDEIKKYPKNFFLAIRCLLFLRNEKIDLLIDLNHSIIWRTLFEIKLINPKWVISPKKGSRYGVDAASLSLYDKQGDANINQPLYLVYLNLLNLLKPKLLNLNNNYYVPLGKEHIERTLKILKGKNKPFICLNFFGGRPEIKLNAESANLIISTIKKQCPSCSIFLISSPSNYLENIYIKNNLFDQDMVEVLQPTSSILDAASFIKSMDLLITPDTSLVHFACTYKVPLIAVYPKERFLFAQWQPISTNRYLVSFSKHTKNLNGYLDQELLKNISYMLRNFKHKKSVKKTPFLNH